MPPKKSGFFTRENTAKKQAGLIITLVSSDSISQIKFYGPFAVGIVSTLVRLVSKYGETVTAFSVKLRSNRQPTLPGI